MIWNEVVDKIPLTLDGTPATIGVGTWGAGINGVIPWVRMTVGEVDPVRAVVVMDSRLDRSFMAYQLAVDATVDEPGNITREIRDTLSALLGP